MDEPLADLSSLGFLALSELAAQHVTVALSGQGADELLGGYRKHRAAALAAAWSRLPGAGADGRQRRAWARGPARLGRACRTLGRAGPGRAAARDERQARRRRCAAQLVRGPLAELDGTTALRDRARAARRRRATTRFRPRSTSTASSRSSTTCSTTSTARRWRTRSRCASRSSTTTSSSSAPRSRRGYKVRRLDTKHVLKRAARGLVPDRIIDKPQDRLLPRAVDALVLGADARRDRATTCSARTRATPSSSTARVRRAARPRHVAGDADTGTPRAARDPDARGLALVVPAARAGRRRRRRAGRRRRSVIRALRGRHAGARRGDEPRRGSPRRSRRRRSARALDDRRQRLDRTARSRSRASSPREHAWIDVALASRATAARPRRARSSARFTPGSPRCAEPPDVVVKLDADISLEPDYFERLLAASPPTRRSGSPAAARSSSSDGEWEQRYVTGSTVWGASRAYRWECLEELLPLEERMGWDGIDEFKANARGWRTTAFEDLPFRHHRREGERDGTPWRRAPEPGSAPRTTWATAPGTSSLRALWHARREPAALAMVWGYAAAAARRDAAEPRRSGPRLPPGPAERAQPAAARARGIGAPAARADA